MNKTNPRDTDRSKFASEWYTSLAGADKARADEWIDRAAKVVAGRPQALELAFVFVLWTVNEPRCARC
jgi:hypothetical protein